MILGLIPARGGSKGIPRKNIKLLGGKPLIQWTIEAARASGVIDRLVLSTEDDEIKAVAEGLGVEVLDRPPELARDDTPMAFVMSHALEALHWGPKILVLLQPTCPFRRDGLIDEAVQTLQARKVWSVVSLTQILSRYSPDLAFFVHDGSAGPLMAWSPTRRQDVRPYYYRDGGVYAFDAAALRKGRNCYDLCVPIYTRTREEGINLDELEDWAEAERHLAERSICAEHDQEATALHAC